MSAPGRALPPAPPARPPVPGSVLAPRLPRTRPVPAPRHLSPAAPIRAPPGPAPAPGPGPPGDAERGRGGWSCPLPLAPPGAARIPRGGRGCRVGVEGRGRGLYGAGKRRRSPPPGPVRSSWGHRQPRRDPRPPPQEIQSGASAALEQTCIAETRDRTARSSGAGPRSPPPRHPPPRAGGLGGLQKEPGDAPSLPPVSLKAPKTPRGKQPTRCLPHPRPGGDGPHRRPHRCRHRGEGGLLSPPHPHPSRGPSLPRLGGPGTLPPLRSPAGSPRGRAPLCGRWRLSRNRSPPHPSAPRSGGERGAGETPGAPQSRGKGGSPRAGQRGSRPGGWAVWGRCHRPGRARPGGARGWPWGGGLQVGAGGPRAVTAWSRLT